MPNIIRFHWIGGPENLKLEELPSQQPARGEVKLKRQAAGPNRAKPGYIYGGHLEEPDLPSRINYEAAGIVEAVGPGVDVNSVGKQAATVPG